MNRQRLAQLRISPLHVQQGLFASLALLVTLIGGQQFERWQHGQQLVERTPVQHATQTHFSSVSSRLAESQPMHMMAVDQAQPVNEAPRQQRWVF
ncbi:hypothetical protein BK634_03525 [Pseudomonas chlororaphis]|jgi:hypothetical protein|uniref:Uncharacterized protein n=1 Tax=Pseudomonas morbosilactucae TaxID=2938197 RepID=A0A9X1YRS0_9PSED|nr:hypothetical protein [Pseudomonas morbosilactucae]MCK9797022.1 hypothetical protein [Pseudomonas morbosilactucae]MCK9812981.1 hypothetical protein [Pseudomonas morbosilactucae]ROL73810.1 hypothetical protein BK634_03525 [Pseudomonas chlororaphis]